MATVSRPELQTGDRMTREEFHRLYEQMPEHVKAELIGGIVYVSSPLSRDHATSHLPLGAVFFAYESATPGVESGDNATILLGPRSEPQPDLFIRILPEFGGQTRNKGKYIQGAPELLSELALSSRAIDLHAKRDDFARYGVLEYIVACLEERQLRWFDLARDVELSPDADGVLRARSFPGLWINQEALWARDFRRLIATLDQGLATPEHAAFKAKLASQHHPSAPLPVVARENA